MDLLVEAGGIGAVVIGGAVVGLGRLGLGVGALLRLYRGIAVVRARLGQPCRVRALLALDRDIVTVVRGLGGFPAFCRRGGAIVRSVGHFHSLLRLYRRVVIIGGLGRRLALRGLGSLGRIGVFGSVGQLGRLLALHRRRIVVVVMGGLAMPSLLLHALDRALDEVGVRVGIGELARGRLLALGRLGGRIVVGQLDAVRGRRLAVRHIAIGHLRGLLFRGCVAVVAVQDLGVTGLRRLARGCLARRCPGSGRHLGRCVIASGGSGLFSVRLVFRRGPGGARCHQHGGQDSQGNPGQQSPRFPVTGQA